MLFSVSLFKDILVEGLFWYYLNYGWKDKGVYTFPWGSSPKLILIVRLQFKLTYYEVLIQHIKQYATGTPTKCVFLLNTLAVIVVGGT